MSTEAPDQSTPLRRIREHRRMTQRQLAKASHVSLRQLGRYEAGTHAPEMRVAERIADVLDCSLDELAGRST